MLGSVSQVLIEDATPGNVVHETLADPSDSPALPRRKGHHIPADMTLWNKHIASLRIKVDIH